MSPADQSPDGMGSSYSGKSGKFPLPLKKLVYGPINSKRLGRSLGINLSGSHRKLCNFNCIYCFYGQTGREPQEKDFPKSTDILTAVETTLKSRDGIDWVTFAGNGEPTLHPEFPDIVAKVRRLVEMYKPGLQIAMLSNGSNTSDTKVQNAIEMIDLPIFKVDAGDDQFFSAINRPLNKFLSIDTVLEGLRDLALLNPMTMQSVLFEGAVSNSSGTGYNHWLDALSYIGPRSLQLYTLDFSIGPVYPVNEDILNSIADDVNSLGIQAHVYLE